MPHEQAPDHQISLTDPDAGAMAAISKGAGLAGYNLPSPADRLLHKLLIVEECRPLHPRDPGAILVGAQPSSLLDSIALALVEIGYATRSAARAIGIEASGRDPQAPLVVREAGLKVRHEKLAQFILSAKTSARLLPHSK